MVQVGSITFETSPYLWRFKDRLFPFHAPDQPYIFSQFVKTCLETICRR